MLPAQGIYIGTSGWSYPKGEGAWKGNFYPAGKIDELEFYSQYFNTVEVNSSFYRPPDPGIARSWARRVPAGFLFSVKLWQKFTHPRMFQAATGEDAVIAAADVDLFRASLEPLAGSGKLGALLAQFPPSFKNDEAGRRILAAVARAFGEYPLAVELRQRTWSDDSRTAEFLRQNDAAWVHIDEPKFTSSIATDVPVTSSLAYFRFHGRNAADWWTGDNETRYRYLYSPQEISELAERIRAAAAGAELLFAFFNNHWKAWAPRNATDMKRALGIPSQQIPMNLDIAEDEPK